MATKTFDASNSTHYLEVTSDSAQTLAGLGSFVIDLGQQSDSTFWSEVSSNGSDIRIVDDTGTLGGSETAYSFTLINFDVNNQTGILIFDGSHLDPNSNTTFRIYVGDKSLNLPANSDTLGRNNIWPSDAEFIWPGNNINDYTGNHTFTKNGGITPGDVAGKVGPATEFDYSDDYLDTTAPSSIPSSAYTVTAWMHSDGFGSSDRTIVGNYDGTGILVRIEIGDDYDLWHDNGSIEGGTLQTNQWVHTVYTFDGSNGQIYVDGTQVASGSLVQSDNGQNLRIGNTQDDRLWDGFLNQVRLYTRHWSQDEAKTQMNNHSDPANFWTTTSTQATQQKATVQTPQPANRINTDQARLYGDVVSDGNNSITERGFVYSQTDPPTTADNKHTVSGTTGTFDELITGLSEDTVYFWRPYAINSEGTSYGAVNYLTTSRQEPSPVNNY